MSKNLDPSVFLTLAFGALFGLGTAFGGQCEGLTKTGERCKREAAENSKYCIGHADQAPAKAAEKPAEPAEKPSAEDGEKPKDDGTCWAVTEKGTRCRHKKVGESDYCAQHAADRKPAKEITRCRALKWDGKQCESAPEPERYYCRRHARLAEKANAKSEKQ